MFVTRLRALALAATAAATLGGCSSYYDDYGYGYGYGRPYSYGSYGYYSQPYAYGSYPYYGWYNNYYYPGVGVYIYDRSGSRYRWDDGQRRYWESRRGSDYRARENWDGYRRDNGNHNGWTRGRGDRRR